MRPCAILALLVALAGCGKVGDPLPPFIRIPEAVRDLSAAQVGEQIVLTWTNPARNIDGSAATDLKTVQIRSGPDTLASVAVNAAGKQQSFMMPSRERIGRHETYALQLETMGLRLSDLSNSVSIVPVEVPGAVTTVRSVVDQGRIVLEWEQPPVPQFADAYIISRSDRPQKDIAAARRYEDPRYVQGQSYTYQVTAARRTDQGLVPGTEGRSFVVVAFDNMAPRAPQGLEAVTEDSGGFLTWEANMETDLAGYQVFRGEGPDGPFTALLEDVHATNAIFDPAYRQGLYYAVSAVDEFGNESARSAPYRVP